jgi:hypothetical protein
MKKSMLKKVLSPFPESMLLPLISSYNKIKSPYNRYKVRNRIVFDEKGIPSVNYGKVNNLKIDIQKNPVIISQQVIAYSDQFKKNKDNVIKEKLLNCANWLVENSVNIENYSLLYYNFPFPIYNLKESWVSAMAQGQAIQALNIANKIESNEKYQEKAKLFLNSFFIEVKNGGVTYKDSEERWWYDEYPSTEGKISRVLNGMNFALFGIYDFYTNYKDKDAQFLFQQGVNALKKELFKYDCGNGYSYYDILHRPAEKYHKIHIEQMKQLFTITGDQIFKKYYDKWKNFDYNKNIPKEILNNILDE